MTSATTTTAQATTEMTAQATTAMTTPATTTMTTQSLTTTAATKTTSESFQITFRHFLPNRRLLNRNLTGTQTYSRSRCSYQCDQISEQKVAQFFSNVAQK